MRVFSFFVIIFRHMTTKKIFLTLTLCSSLFWACDDSESNPAATEQPVCDATTETQTFSDESGIVFTCHNSTWMTPEQLKAALDAELGPQNNEPAEQPEPPAPADTTPVAPPPEDNTVCAFTLDDPVWAFDFVEYGNTGSALYEINDEAIYQTVTTVSKMKEDDCNFMVETMGGADSTHYCTPEGLFQVEPTKYDLTKTSKEEVFEEAQQKCKKK